MAGPDHAGCIRRQTLQSLQGEGCANSDVTCGLLVRVGRQLGTL
jgi:hypothetical protein